MPDSSPATGTSSVDSFDRDVDVPPVTLDDFSVVKVLASTAGISSCLARREGDFGFNKRVLLKVADETFDESPETNMRLNEEARIGMRLAHPNLLQILDLGRDADRTFLVREWVEGLGLRALLRRVWDDGRTLPVPASLRIGVGVARALSYLHGVRASWAPRGVAHRAVTPSNILLSRFGEVRLANLSLADPSAQFDSEARPVENGYPAFCAPEVLEGARADAAADVFGLGAVLYEAFTGPTAFMGPTHSDWLRYRTSSDIQDRVRATSLPGPLRQMLTRATSPAPEQRPSALQLREFLRRWLDSEYGSTGEDELRSVIED